MTVWTGVAQRCQKEAPLFSPGIPIQLQGPLLGPQEKKLSSSSSSRNQNSSNDTNYYSATTAPFHSVPGPTLSLHKHLQTARHP